MTLWDAVCSLYGEDRAKTNFPASDYAHYLALAAQHAAAGQAAEPLANASQLVEELQQVVSPPLSGGHALLICPGLATLAWPESVIKPCPYIVIVRHGSQSQAGLDQSQDGPRLNWSGEKSLSCQTGCTN